MNWEDVGKKIIELGAPLLGDVLGFPGADAIVNAVISAFPGDNGEVLSSKELLNKIESNPSDAAIKLKQIEETNKVELLRLKASMAATQYANEQSIAQSNTQDRSGARKLEEDKLKDGYKDPMYKIVGLAVIFGFLSSLAACFLIKIDPSVENVIFYMLGSLNTAFLAVVFFYFGSSASSARKDNYIQGMKQ